MFPRTVYTLGYLGQVDEGDDVISDEDLLQIDPADKARLQCQYAGGQYIGGRCVYPPQHTDEDILDEAIDDLSAEEQAALACAYQEGSWDAETQVCTPRGQFPIPPGDVDELRCLYQEGVWNPITRFCAPKGGTAPQRPPTGPAASSRPLWPWVAGGVAVAAFGYMLWDAA